MPTSRDVGPLAAERWVSLQTTVRLLLAESGSSWRSV